MSSTNDAPQFIIDSEDRISGDIESFEVKLEVKPNNTYDSVALVHCGIPKSYYNVDSINNEFTFIENGSSYTIYVPVGEYTKTNLPAIWKAAMDAESLAQNPSSPWTYSIIWNSFTYKWEFTVTDHASRALVPATSGLSFSGHQTHDILGFTDEATYNYNSSGFLTSDNVVHFQRTNYITIKSNICHNNGNNAPDSQILARIPVKNVEFGQLITFDLIQLNDGTKAVANNRRNLYNFSLYDDHDSLLYLNGRDWFLTLFLYEFNKLAKLEIAEIERTLRKREIEREKAIDLIDPNKSSIIEPPVPEHIDVVNYD